MFETEIYKQMGEQLVIMIQLEHIELNYII